MKQLHQPALYDQCCMDLRQRYLRLAATHHRQLDRAQEAVAAQNWMLAAGQGLQTSWHCYWAHLVAAVWLTIEHQWRWVQLMVHVQDDRQPECVLSWHQPKQSW